MMKCRYLAPLWLLTLLLFVSGSLLAQSPAITSFSPASGSIGTLVIISGTDLGSPTTFTIGGVSPIVLSNTGTTLTALVMPGTAASAAISLSTVSGTATG